MTHDKSKPLVLVDGSSYLYRAYHAMPELSNSKHQPTGAVYGVVNMLRRLQKDYDSDHIAVVFDAKGKTFRNDLYADYKANRPPMPDDLRGQIEPLHKIVRAMGFPLLMVTGVEADDVIGTLATRASKAGWPVVISTGDKDMAQLVDEQVSLINTMTETPMDRDGVIEKFGVPPERITDYLALIGDKVDNVPGVPKVGPVTAVKWLTEHGSLDNIIANADKIGGKVGENLRDTLDYLPLAHDLVTIRCELELEQDYDQLAMRTPDRDTLVEMFRDLEFKSWLAEQLDHADPTDATPAASPQQTDYQTITSRTELDKWIKKLQQAELFAFDTETTSLDYMQAELVGVSFSFETGSAAYVPCAHDYPGAPDQISRDELLQALKPLLEDPDKIKIGQHMKYDMNVLARYDIDLQGVAYDTMLESYVLDSTATRHDMDSLSLKYLEHKTIKFEEVAGKGAKQITFNQVDLDIAGPYASEDADVTLRLHQTLWPQLLALPSLKNIFETIEIPLLPVLSRIERNGVLVDADMLAKQSSELAHAMLAIQKQSYEHAGGEFNLSSPKQIQQILFEQQGLPVLKKTPKGAPSTAEEVLQELALDYELPQLILNYRSMSKLKSTYTDKLPKQIDPDSGRVHTSYHQAVAATGRLSSTDPNLQNIPVRSKEGRRIRQAFIAPPGSIVLAADYSQIELRIMAHLSEDPGLLTAFAEGLDVHRATAAEVFNLPADQVSDDQRRSAKAINFGLIYGMSAFGLARQLGITRGEAQQYVNLYFERYPGVKQYMEQTREQAREQGYVETVYGRRLYLPEINARNGQRRQYAERTAINAPMQGTAADIIKLAMIDVDKWLQGDAGEQVRMIMQVHDELVFEVHESYLESATDEIRKRMQRAAELSVPLVVDIGTGENWEAAH